MDVGVDVGADVGVGVCVHVCVCVCVCVSHSLLLLLASCVSLVCQLCRSSLPCGKHVL